MLVGVGWAGGGASVVWFFTQPATDSSAAAVRVVAASAIGLIARCFIASRSLARRSLVGRSFVVYLSHSPPIMLIDPNVGMMSASW